MLSPRAIVSLTVVLATAATADASPFHRQQLLVAAAGFGVSGDDMRRVGEGAIVEVAYELRPWSRLGLRAETSGYRFDRQFHSARVDGSGRWLGVSALLYLKPTGQGQLYLAGGIGRLHIDRRWHFSDRPESWDSDAMAGSLGLGARVFVGPNWYFEPQARVLVDDDLNGRANLTLGIGYRWPSQPPTYPGSSALGP